MRRVLLLIPLFLYLIPGLCLGQSNILYRTPDGVESGIQAEFILYSPVNDVWNLLTNYKNSASVMPNIEKTTVLKKEKKDTIVKTTVRQGVFSMTYTSRLHENKDLYSISWDQIEGPFSINSGSWELTPLSPDTTRVVYTIELNHPLMPDSIRKNLVKRSIPGMYRSLKKILHSS